MKKKSYLSLILVFILMYVIFYQTHLWIDYELVILKNLMGYLPQKPFESILSQWSFQYNREQISVYAVGYYAFVLFLLRTFITFLLLSVLSWTWFTTFGSHVKNNILRAFAAIIATVIFSLSVVISLNGLTGLSFENPYLIISSSAAVFGSLLSWWRH